MCRPSCTAHCSPAVTRAQPRPAGPAGRRVDDQVSDLDVLILVQCQPAFEADVAVDAGVVGRSRDQDLPGSRPQEARQSACHRVEFARVPELGQLPGQAQGVGGACWADLSHVCKTFSIVFSAVATLLGRLGYVMGKSK